MILMAWSLVIVKTFLLKKLFVNLLSDFVYIRYCVGIRKYP